MNGRHRKERERELRRGAIIDAAERQFFAKGFHATMDDIAADAEVAKGTLYLHFSSKEDLYITLICRGLDLLRTQFTAVVSDTGDVIEKVQRIGGEFVRFHDEKPEYFRLIHDGSHAISETQVSSDALNELHRSSSAVWQVFADVLQQGIDQGLIRSDVTAFELAIILWTNLSGMLRQLDMMKKPSPWMSSPSPYGFHSLDPARLLAMSRSIVLEGLRSGCPGTGR